MEDDRYTPAPPTHVNTRFFGCVDTTLHAHHSLLCGGRACGFAFLVSCLAIGWRADSCSPLAVHEYERSGEWPTGVSAQFCLVMFADVLATLAQVDVTWRPARAFTPCFVRVDCAQGP